MAIWSLLNPFGWFSSGPAKLSGGNQPGAPYGLDGYANAAGKVVSPETAMRLSAYWACVKLYGQTMGSLPLELYRSTDGGGQVLASDDPLYDILRHQPCADHDAVEFWEGIGACLANWGNAYALKVMNGARLIALEPLRPFWMQVYRGDDGAPIYRYSDPTTKQVDYTPDQIFHVRGFGFCDIVGLTPLAFFAQFLGASIAADEVGGSLFRHGMRIAGWFRYKGGNGILTKAQQDETRHAFKDYVGTENAGKAGILPGDFDWLPTTMNPADAQLLENRRFNVEEICRAFGIPPILVGHIAQGQTMWGSGVEHIVLAWMTTGFRPHLRRVEAAIGRQIIGRAGRQTLNAVFDVEQLLRGDNKGMADTASQLANNGIKTRDEIRRDFYNLPPIPGGNKATVQGALIPIDKLGEIARLPKDKPVEPGADVGSIP